MMKPVIGTNIKLGKPRVPDERERHAELSQRVVLMNSNI